MKLLSVQIENFMAIGNATISLADRGLVLIQGENEDDTSAISNGAGKSSIADAICWCLYGATARGEDGDGVVNITAGKGTAVSIDIEEETKIGEFYRIARYRKHKTYKNTLRVIKIDGATSTDLTKGTDKLTQEVVTQIMGCSLDVFWGAIYAGQERMPDIPGMTDKQLKMLIEEASGATLLEAAYAEANKRLLKQKGDLATAQSRAENAAKSEADAVSQLANGEIAKNDFERARILAVKDIHAEALGVKKTLADTKADLAKLPVRDVLEAYIKTLDKQIASVDGEILLDRQNSAKFDEASKIYSAEGTRLGSFQRTLATALKNLADLDHKIGCPCGECDRPFEAADIEPAKKLAAVQVEKATEAVRVGQENVERTLRAFTSAADARDAYRASMTDLSATINTRAAQHVLLRNVTHLEHAIVGLESDLANCIRAIKTKRDEINPFIVQIVQAESDLEHKKAFATLARVEVVEATTALKIATHVAQVFSPGGVRAFLLDEVTPFLNDQTAKYLGTLSDGNISATWTTLIKNAKGELREKFSVEISSTTGGATFKSVSGGEKRKVRIACALALQDLVARRASKPIELFIGDEIDDALDPAGLQRLAEILEEKARERGSVFVISHNDLKDYVRNTITVKKVGGKATVEETIS